MQESKRASGGRSDRREYGPEAGPESRKARSNRLRRAATRAALLDAARSLFAEKGYAETGTSEIVARAGVTRGALYHHFADKLELFRAVVEREAAAVAEHIVQATQASASALDAMRTGADAYFDAMAVAGRGRLLLLEGPAVLGIRAMEEIDRRTGGDELRQGLELAISRAEGVEMPVDALAAVLSAAFDKAALAIVSGESAEDYKRALRILTSGIPGLSPDPG